MLKIKTRPKLREARKRQRLQIMSRSNGVRHLFQIRALYVQKGLPDLFSASKLEK